MTQWPTAVHFNMVGHQQADTDTLACRGLGLNDTAEL
jgi:hypothetical protein